MATAREYAQWIVDNESKAGTPDFNVVAQAYQRAKQLESQAAPQPPAPPEGVLSSFGRGLSSYGPQLQETFGGLQALAGKTLADTVAPQTGASLIKSGVERMQAAEKQTQAATRPGEASFTEALDKGIGTVLTEWLPYQVGSGTANLLETLGVMGVGALAGSAAPGVGTVIGAVTGAVEKELIKKGVREAAKKIALEMGEEASKKFVEKETLAVTKGLARKYGMEAAVAGQAAGYGFGQTASRAVEAAIERGEKPEDIDLARVIPAGMVSTAAEFVSDKLAFGALKGLKKEVKDAVEGTTRTVLQRAVGTAGNMAKGVAITGTKEAPTEIIQSLAERFGAKLSLSDEKAIDEYINAIAASYAMSVVPGAIGGIKTKPVEAETKPAKKLLALENKPDPLIVFPDGSVGRREDVENYINSLPEDQRNQARARLMGMGEKNAAPVKEGAPLTEDEIFQLDQQLQMGAPRPQAEDVLGQVRGAIQTAPATTQEDVARIRDDHETAVINSLLEQDRKMQTVSDLARLNVERASQTESMEAATQDADRRVREGRLMGRVQSLIDLNIPFASTAIADINRKFEMIGEAPLDDNERSRVQNIMTMAQGFTDFVKLPSLPAREQDIFAENQAMQELESSYKEQLQKRLQQESDRQAQLSNKKKQATTQTILQSIQKRGGIASIDEAEYLQSQGIEGAFVDVDPALGETISVTSKGMEEAISPEELSYRLAQIKERKPRGQVSSQPLRAEAPAPSQGIQETPVSTGIEEGRALRPEGGIEPGITKDSQLSTELIAEPAEETGKVKAEQTPTERQEAQAFGKAIGAVQPYPGMLKGRVNLPAQKAAKEGNFQGVITALEKSKNPIVSEIAKRSKELGTSIVIDEKAAEKYVAKDRLNRQFSIDGAKMHLDALNKIRQIAPAVDAMPSGSRLGYDIILEKVPAIEQGKESGKISLEDIAKNGHSMFAPLPTGPIKLRTKEDFKALQKAFEDVTDEFGEDKLKLTSTASSLVNGVAAEYDADSDTIRIPEHYAKREEVVAHEIVHAQVLKSIANPTSAQKPVVARLENLYQHVKEQLKKKESQGEYYRAPYAIESIQEFIAEGMANPSFQLELKRIKYENTSAWDAFVQFIANLIGVKNDTAFTELLSIYSDLTVEPKTDVETTLAPAAPIEAKPVTPPIQFEQQAKQQHAVQGLGIVEIPVNEVQLSEDVPQFKSDADQAGVVERLEGKFERTGVAPIQVWRRRNGRLEVISGRHRLDLAQRTGEATIPAQIHDEASGFDATKAATLDAELNIRDGQGKVKDYVVYFEKSGITEDEAKSRGLLGRALGKRAWAISSKGSPELIAAHRGGVIDDAAAEAIASTVPSDERLQAVGIKAIQDGKNTANAVNMIQAVRAMTQDRVTDTTFDMFGFDDSAIKEAENMAKAATQKQAEIDNRLRAISGAAKRPDIAKKEGVDIRDPNALKTRIEELKKERAAWNNWATNPDLVAEVRQSLRPTTEEGEGKKSLRAGKAQQLSDFEQTLRTALNRFGLKDIGLKLINGMTAEGSYAQKLIQIAADSANPIRTLRHEAIHALRELGFFTPQQWQSLSKMAKDKWIDQYLKQRNVDGKPLKSGEESRYDAYMREYNGDMEKITEEAVADAFADFDATKPPSGLMQALLARLRNLFQSIKSALTKVESPEKIFGKVERGELVASAREEAGEKKSLRDRATANFLRWFGNSKVVDEKGEPLVVYHGTTGNILEFKKTALGVNTKAKSAYEGFFFTSSTDNAAEYAGGEVTRSGSISVKEIISSWPADDVKAFKDAQAYRDSLKPKGARTDGWMMTDEWRARNRAASDLFESLLAKNASGANIMPVFLSLKNPFVYDMKGQEFRDVSYADLIKEAKAQKRDGLIIKNTFDPKFGDVFVAFEPTQIKSAIGNNGEYSLTNADIRKSLRTPGKTEEIARKIEAKVAPPKERIEVKSFEHIKDKALMAEIQRRFNPKPETIVDRVNSMRENFWERMAQGIVDKYRAIKKYSDEGYMLARMSNTVDGAVEGLLFHGQVFNDGGALNIKPNTEGLYEAFKPLGKELDNFLIWMAMSRDANLPEEKRSFSAAALAAKDELIEGSVGGRPRKEVYNEVRRKMNVLNKSVLDVAKQAGIIDQEGYDRFSSDLYYVPMYKVTEEGELVPVSGEKLTDQFFSKELKGNKDLAFGDLMQNIVQNWSHILSASMKNIAATKVMEDAERFDAVRPSLKAQYEYENGVVYKVSKEGREEVGELRPEHTTKKPGTVKVIKDGMPVYYEVGDPLLLDSIAGITWLGPQGKWLDVAKDFKNMLQFGVTISPAFRVRNLIRDAVSAISIADIKKNPVRNAIEGMNFYDPKDPNYIGALAGGGMMKFGAAMEGGMSENIKRLVKAGVPDNTILDSPEKIKNGLKYLYNKYEEWGNKMENANRLAIYQQARAKGMSHLEASFHAKDLMDFTLHGSFPAFRRLTMVIPFLNARVQGLYKLGRDGITPTYRLIHSSLTGKEITESDKKKGERFAIVASAVGLASAALYLAFKDDEEFKKREQWDRDNFWWIKFPGMEHAFRIPKPFELGAFGTLVERSLEQIVDQGAEGKVFGEAMTRMLSDTFAINPIPQMFKPVLDIYANKDSFTGAPIETAGMEKLSKQERVADSTSWIGKGLGGVSKALATVTTEKAELSPVQVEYLIKGYFGWLGAMATSTAHYAAMPFSQGAYPNAKYADTFSMGFIKELPATQSKFVTSFYDNNEKIQQAMADMRHYAALGEIEKAQKIQIEQGDKINLAKFYDKASDDMAKMRKHIRIITADDKMTGAEKRDQIDRAKLIIAEIARQAEELRVAMKK